MASLIGIAGADTTETSTTQEHQLGLTAPGNDGNPYVYVQADEALAAYAACRFLEDGGADELTTTNSGSVPTTVVVPQVAIASSSYGWAVKSGMSFSVLAAASCAADVKVYTTATAGVIDDAATDLIDGLRLNATVGGAQAATNASAMNGMQTNSA